MLNIEITKSLWRIFFEKTICIVKFQYIRGDNSYKKTPDPFDPNVTKLYLATTNIFLIILGQPSLTISEVFS